MRTLCLQVDASPEALASYLFFKAAGPVQVMEREHDAHGEALETLRRMTGTYTPPEGACVTWRALYLGLRQLDQELMEHIHLENNILFPRALAS